MKSIEIRANRDGYMRELRAWLSSTADTPLEEMSAFFAKRLDSYEAHMSAWGEAYQKFASFLPMDCTEIVDLGCGTGLELQSVFARFPNARVTGIDMSADMLAALSVKYGDKAMRTICGDYFTVEFGKGSFDAVISFQSLHHFTPQKKTALFKKILDALKPGGKFLNCDYFACCDEEETLLFAECARRRAAANIPDTEFVHFDTPLTLAHEAQLLKNAGFAKAEPLESCNGAVFLLAEKK